MLKAEDLVDLIQSAGDTGLPFRLGTIAAGYTTGQPAVTFDGEGAASIKTYPFL
jgi:hypothetical protein